MKENWKYKKLGEIAEISSGNSAPQGDIFFENGIYPFVRTGDVGKIHFSSNFDTTDDNLNELGIKGLRLFPKGSILFPKSGASTLLNHRVRLSVDAYVVSHLAVIIPNEKIIDGKFLLYHTTTIDSANLVNDISYPSLRTSDLENLSIPVPPLSVQRQIVAELDLLSDIIEKQKQQISELDKLAQATFYDMFGDPNINDKKWNTLKFKDAFKLKSGDGLVAKDFVDGEYPVYGGNGLCGHHNEYNKNAKTIIIGRVGVYCGNARLVKDKFWLTDNAFETSFNDDLFVYEWLPYLLNTINLHQYANHAAQPVISNVGLKDINIILPPISLQQSFASKIEAIERQKELISNSIKESRKLFDSRMEYWFG